MLKMMAEEKRVFNITIGRRTLHTDLYYLAKIMTRVRMGFSPIVAICGKQRIGKSLVGVWLSMIFMHLMGKPYDPTTRTFYDPIEAITNLETEDRLPLLIDEAGDILHRREYYLKIHQSLNKIIQTQAYKTILYIFVSPFISDIDKSFIKHFDFIIRVDDRGRYKAFEILKKYDRIDVSKSIKIKFLDDVRIRIADVPGDIWGKYKTFSIEQKEAMRKRLEKRERAMKRVMQSKDDDMTDPLRGVMKRMGVKL